MPSSPVSLFVSSSVRVAAFHSRLLSLGLDTGWALYGCTSVPLNSTCDSRVASAVSVPHPSSSITSPAISASTVISTITSETYRKVWVSISENLKALMPFLPRSFLNVRLSDFWFFSSSSLLPMMYKASLAREWASPSRPNSFKKPKLCVANRPRFGGDSQAHSWYRPAGKV
jgi:hypothetical protein